MSHTPGDWQVGGLQVWHYDEETGMGYRFRVIENEGGAIAWVADDDGDPECVPNMHVVAAAPDLLEALRRLVRFNENDPQLYDGDDDGTLSRLMRKANSAVDKARNTSEES